MNTYAFRLKFYTFSQGTLIGEGKDYNFILPNNKEAKISCIDQDKFEESTIFAIMSGGYKTKDDAYNCASKMKESILSYAVKYRMGLDLGKDRASSFASQELKNRYFEAEGIKIVDDMHGICVYNEEHPVSFQSLSIGPFTISPPEQSIFCEEVCKIMSLDKCIDEKTKLAMELLTTSYFESSQRSRFLTMVLAAEALLDPDNRSNKAKKVVKYLVDYTKNADIDTKEKDSMLGSMRYLYKDSISYSLQKMAEKYLSNKKYNEISSKDFIKKCYTVRSQLVHNGNINESKYDISMLAAYLEMYLTDMLTKIVEI